MPSAEINPLSTSDHDSIAATGHIAKEPLPGNFHQALTSIDSNSGELAEPTFRDKIEAQAALQGAPVLDTNPAMSPADHDPLIAAPEKQGHSTDFEPISQSAITGWLIPVVVAPVETQSRPQPEQQPQPALPQDHDPQLPEQPEQPERSQPAATPSEDEQPPATQTGDNMGNGPTDPPDGVHSAEEGESKDKANTPQTTTKKLASNEETGEHIESMPIPTKTEPTTKGDEPLSEVRGLTVRERESEQPLKSVDKREIRFARSEPAAWQGLMEMAEASQCENVPYEQQTEAAVKVLEAAAQLGHDERALSRYYGLGLVTCRLAQFVADPTMEEAFIEEGVGRLVTRQAERCINYNFTGLFDRSHGVYISMVHSDGFELLVRDTSLMTEACAGMSVAERLVANALQSLGNSNAEVLQNETLRTAHVTGVLKNPKAHRAVVAGSLSFAASTLRQTIALHHTRNTGNLSDFSTWEGWAARISDALPSHQITDLDFRKVNAVIASLRLDEARDALQKIELDDDGQPFLDRKQLPTVPDPDIAEVNPGQLQPSMSARQGCPALYVTGALPFAEKSIAEIVKRTQARYGY
jgi:hypothetical protein